MTGAESQAAKGSKESASSAEAGGFSSVGGLHKQKEALRRAVVLPLRHPALLRALGARPGRGALLHGPPGSGKTLLAAAIAAEAGVHLEVCCCFCNTSAVNYRSWFRCDNRISASTRGILLPTCPCFVMTWMATVSGETTRSEG